jgi:ketosteroid isomerase-like protein
MKNTIKILKISIVCLSLVFAFTNCTQKKETKENTFATVEELGQMNRDFAKALIAGDAEAAANLYDENASLLPPNEPIVTGRENIRKYWQGAIDAGIVGASVKTIAASSDGDLGYEIGTFELQFKGENDSIIIDSGKYTEILQRNSEGKWISLYGMWSNNE